MLKELTSTLNQGKNFYTTYKKEIILASNIKIKNKELARELEVACEKKNGILTFPEYLMIDQFGKNGFYAKNAKHGKTDIDKRWGSTLARYCHKFGFEKVIELGCGTGDLGVAIAKAYKKHTGKSIKWIGVEIDSKIHTKILDHFTSNKVQDSVEKIVTTIDELQTKDNVLVVFPYSLDSILPQVFLNVTSIDSYPNALLGITVKNGKISEKIIPPEIIKDKGLQLKDGFFTQNHYTYKLSQWKLRKGQRAYITIESFTTLYQYTKKFGNKTTFIVIDEFRKDPWFFDLRNLGTPKSLYEHNLICDDRTRYYRESGRYNFYYPLYKNSLLSFLNIIGFQKIEYDIEQKMANHLRGKPWISLRKSYATYAFIASNLVKKKIDFLTIPFNKQKIF